MHWWERGAGSWFELYEEREDSEACELLVFPKEWLDVFYYLTKEAPPSPISIL